MNLLLPSYATARLLRCVHVVAVLLVALTCATSAQAQTLRIVAANAAGGDVYEVAFSDPSGTTTLLNADANTHVSIRSVAFRAASGSIDLIAADTLGGKLLLYRNALEPSATGLAEVIWSSYQGPGPVKPDALSVDSAGNLYVASTKPGKSTQAQLWKFPKLASSPSGFGVPVLLDSNFGKSLLEETLLVRTAGSIAAPADLLVLAGNPARVYRYPGGSGPRQVLLDSNKFPYKASPGGMDIWPVDGSLLVTTGDGKILRFAPTGMAMPNFATALGNGKFKIRTALQAGASVAVVANNNGGQILKFTGPGAPVAVVTSGVQHPQGVAVTNAAVGDAGACAQTEGCDLLGNLLTHRVESSNPLSGFILEEPCVVQADPRVDVAGVCNGQPLPVASICPGFGNGVIPGHLCGGSGSSGKGFVMVRTETNFLVPSGSVVFSDAFAETALTEKPPCTSEGTDEIAVWGPSDGEGTIVEGNALMDVTTGCINPVRSASRGFSTWSFGLVLDIDSSALSGTTTTAKLRSFTIGKYTNLDLTVTAANITSAVKASLTSCLNYSRNYFNSNKYSKAKAKLDYCRGIVESHAGDFSPTTSNPNPYGEVLGRIDNLIYTIGYRFL